MNKSLLVSVLALVLASVSVVFPRTTERVVETVTLGASGSGQDTTSTQSFLAGIVLGGVHSTSTTGTVVLQASALDDESIVYVLPTGATTLTLPASTSLTAVVPKVGMTRTYTVFNRGTSTNAVTLAGNTGVTLTKASTTVVANGSTSGTNGFYITMTRLFNNNIAVQVDNFGQ